MGFSRQEYWSGVPLPSLLSYPTRDQTHVPCIGRWILNHWTIRAVYFKSVSCLGNHSFHPSFNFIGIKMCMLFFFFLMFKVFEAIACFIPVVFFCILCLFDEILFESCLFSWCFKVLVFPHSLFVPFEIRLGLSPGWVSFCLFQAQN